MSPLEQNIINLLPTLSNEAKEKARFILGEKKKVTKRKPVLTHEEARLIIQKSFDKWF